MHSPPYLMTLARFVQISNCCDWCMCNHLQAKCQNSPSCSIVSWSGRISITMDHAGSFWGHFCIWFFLFFVRREAAAVARPCIERQRRKTQQQSTEESVHKSAFLKMGSNAAAAATAWKRCQLQASANPSVFPYTTPVSTSALAFNTRQTAPEASAVNTNRRSQTCCETSALNIHGELTWAWILLGCFCAAGAATSPIIYKDTHRSYKRSSPFFFLCMNTYLRDKQAWEQFLEHLGYHLDKISSKSGRNV